MKQDRTLYPIVQHKTSGTLYRYLGEDNYENILTGAKGVVSAEDAKKVFLFCVDLSQMAFDYPNVVGLIKIFGLKRKLK